MFDLPAYKPSIGSLLLFAAYYLLVGSLLKFVLVKWPVPGLTQMALAA
jgi:hypothetical protein